MGCDHDWIMYGIGKAHEVGRTLERCHHCHDLRERALTRSERVACPCLDCADSTDHEPPRALRSGRPCGEFGHRWETVGPGGHFWRRCRDCGKHDGEPDTPFQPCYVCGTDTRYRSRFNGEPCCGDCLS
jgi:hypothetical protein